MFTVVFNVYIVKFLLVTSSFRGGRA